MGSSRFTRRVAVGLLAGATVVGLSVMAGSASAAPNARYPLNGSTPRWLHQAQDLGSSQTTGQVNFGVLLGLRDQAGAVATLQAISDPAITERPTTVAPASSPTATRRVKRDEPMAQPPKLDPIGWENTRSPANRPADRYVKRSH